MWKNVDSKIFPTEANCWRDGVSGKTLSSDPDLCTLALALTHFRPFDLSRLSFFLDSGFYAASSFSNVATLIIGSSTTFLTLLFFSHYRSIALVVVLISCLSVRTVGTFAGGADDL
jgi:hypothetical protein